MKTFTISLMTGILLLSFFSCGKDEVNLEYPRVYKFENFEIRTSQYVRLNQSGWDLITPGGYFTSLEDEILSLIPDVHILLTEISLLDETSVKVVAVEPMSGETIDTTINYSLIDNQLVIEDYNPNAIFEISEDLETIELCNFTYFHTILSSQIPYSPIDNSFCTRLDGADPVEYVKDQFNWVEGDTIATVFSAWVYELQ